MRIVSNGVSLAVWRIKLQSLSLHNIKIVGASKILFFGVKIHSARDKNVESSLSAFLLVPFPLFYWSEKVERPPTAMVVVDAPHGDLAAAPAADDLFIGGPDLQTFFFDHAVRTFVVLGWLSVVLGWERAELQVGSCRRSWR